MITETIEVRGVRLDVSHDGDVIHEVQTYGDQEDIYPLLDMCIIAELRAILFGQKAQIEEPVYEVPTLDDSPTRAGAIARRPHHEH